MPLVGEEVFDLVDERGRVIGQATRSECHGNPSLVHRAVHVLVFNTGHFLYLQRRSTTKMIQPGMWDSSVGGHLSSGESYRQAAVREMAEELGVVGAALEYLFDFKIRNSIESENIRTFCTTWDEPITFDTEEIEEGRFWSMSDIGRAVGTGVLTPSFEQEYSLLTKFHHLPVEGA